MSRVFEEILGKTVLDIRSRLREVESISSLDLHITCTGRVHDGEVQVLFHLGSSYSDGGQVKGGSLDYVVDEYMRRFGWDRRNAALLLSDFSTKEIEPPPAATPPVSPFDGDESPF